MNYPTSIPDANNSADGAAWRVEISPRAPAITDDFLNVLQVMNAGSDVSPLPVSKMQNSELVGARIADRVVLFARSGKTLNRELQVVVDGGATVQLFVADLAPGRWVVMPSDETASAMASTPTVTLESGVLTAVLKPGGYTLIPLRPLPVAFEGRPLFELAVPRRCKVAEGPTDQAVHAYRLRPPVATVVTVHSRSRRENVINLSTQLQRDSNRRFCPHVRAPR